MPVPYQESDYSDLFNTALSPEEEAAFALWQQANPHVGSTYDYDARGFWKAGAEQADNGHGSDKWKKPNHPTFSNQSMYHGIEGMAGGQWLDQPDGGYVFMTSPTNELYHGREDLQRYFEANEPKGKLVYGRVKGDIK